MTEPARGEKHALSPIFEPRSIAVVGASADPAKRGHQILRALGTGGYQGEVYPVNPKEGSILGYRTYPSIGALPEAPDLAVLATPAAAAPELVVACGERGIPGAIVLAVGFGESGAEGRALEGRLVAAARAGGVRLVGPNTSGLINTHRAANLIGARDIRPGGIALLVQSGNMALSLMNEATTRSWEGISVCVGLGNESDIGFSEALDYLGEDLDTRGIIVYAEGLRDARGFLRTADRVSATKPIVVIKAGRSDRGAAAARSHTGAITGSYDRLRTGFTRAGVTEVARTDELFHVAETLANQSPLAPGTGIAILSDGGGQGTLAVDALTEARAPLASLSDATRSRLRDLLGPAAAVDNPVDVAGAGDADPTVFGTAHGILIADEGVGAVLLVGLFGGYGIRFAAQLEHGEVTAARAMAGGVASTGKALVVHSMYAAHRSPPLGVLGEARIPVVESLDVACRCTTELARRATAVTGPARVWDLPAPSPTPDVIRDALTRGRTALTEPEARTLLAGHGLDFGSWVVANDAREATAAVVAIDGPAAVKLVSGRILHKADASGVRLGLSGEAEARRAFEDIHSAAGEYADRHRLEREPPAVLVSPMAPPGGLELILGAARDPQLGPVLTLGAGGTWVELVSDVAHAVLPATRAEVHDLLGRLRLAPVLGGARGGVPLDVEAVVDAALALSACVLATPEIAEVEVNPLCVYEAGAIGLDARVILAGASHG